MQTGPMAELIIGGDPLTTDLHQKEGASTCSGSFPVYGELVLA
nr:hypothetical protein [Enterovibrio nigricans]